MNGYVESFAYWLADFYLLSTLLLATAMGAIALVGQPAKRLAIAKSAMVALALLAVLCALPGWSAFHLLSQRADEPLAAQPVAAEVVPQAFNQPVLQAPSAQQRAATPVELTRPPRVNVVERIDVSLSTIVASAHLVGSALIVGWLALGALAMRSILRAARPAPLELCRLLARLDGIDERQFKLLVSERLDVAVAVGALRTAVVLPSHWVDDRSADELQTVLVHEAAHVRNCDLAWLAFGRMLLVVLWSQPLFWWLRRSMGLDQETLADVAAAEITSRRQYAEQLVAWAREMPARRRIALSTAVGLWEGPSQLRRRIVILLDEQLQLLRHCPRPWRAKAGGAIVLAALGLSLLTLQPASRAAEEPAADTKAEEGESLEYGGAIVDKQSGKPAAGATVVVRRKTSSTNPWKTLAETQHTTDAEGRYRFTIPPDQLADSKLYIELDVTHPNYAPKTGFGYALSMIRKNEKLGQKPFFDRVEMEPAEVITGIVTAPNGKPLAAMPVLAYSKADPDDLQEYGYFARGATDDQGRFQLNVTKGGKAILWLLPDDYSQQTLVLDDRRGELGVLKVEGTIQLQTKGQGELVFNTSPRDQGTLSIEGGTLSVDGGTLSVDGETPSQEQDSAERLALAFVGPRDLGTLAVEDGIRLRGKVVGVDGTPIPNVWVNAELEAGPAKKQIDMPVADAIERSALTDASGEFALAPLPAGTYRVLPEENPDENPRRDREPRPLPAVFAPLRVELAAGVDPQPLAIQAAEPVTIEIQLLDSAGQPRSGHPVTFFGRFGGEPGEFYTVDGRPDSKGRIVLQVPKGVNKAELDISCNEHQVLKYRRKHDWPLRAERRIEFGTLNEDQRGIEIVYYTAPILTVAAKDADGKPIDDFKPAVFYREGVKPREIGSRWLSGVEGEVNFEHQEDGRWRSEQLIPDEEFVVNVFAPGFEPAAKSLKLGEGDVRDVEVVLQRSDAKAAKGADAPKPRYSIITIDGTYKAEDSAGETVLDLLNRGELAKAPNTVAPNTIWGLCVDDTGKPLAGVEVALYRIDRQKGDRQELQTTLTNDAGAYAFVDVVDIAREYPNGVPKLSDVDFAGEPILQVVARKPGQATATRIDLAPRIADTGVKFDLEMPAAATLSGRVFAEEGRPVKGALVTVRSGADPWESVCVARTDAEGRYEINDLSSYDHATAERQQAEMARLQAEQAKGGTGTFLTFFVDRSVRVTHPDFATREVRCDKIPGTQDIRLKPPATIVGRVVDGKTGRGVANAKVGAGTSRPKTREWQTYAKYDKGGNLLYYTEQTTTDAEGRYRFENLPEMDYDVWSISEPAKSPGLERVAAKAGETTEAPDLKTMSTGTIRIRLLDTATNEPLPKEMLKKTMFALMPKNSVSALPTIPLTAEPKDGEFELEVYPGEFHVFCGGLIDDGQLDWVPYPMGPEELPAVTVTEGETSTVEIRMKNHEPNGTVDATLSPE
jgi:beta-lactamase regulating signal transducer with metallopeptidase domain/5-hydroxyisourate hydrolase-like protein (transthyretin family)/protocatechuate 3,4-dioxygenase beta subunit